MKGLYTKEIRLPKDDIPIDPRKTWKMIDEINDIETKFEREIMLYDDIDIN
jgi:hypothetical protein